MVIKTLMEFIERDFCPMHLAYWTCCDHDTCHNHKKSGITGHWTKAIFNGL